MKWDMITAAHLLYLSGSFLLMLGTSLSLYCHIKK